MGRAEALLESSKAARRTFFFRFCRRFAELLQTIDEANPVSLVRFGDHLRAQERDLTGLEAVAGEGE